MRIFDEIPSIDSLCVFRQTQAEGNLYENTMGRPHFSLSLRVFGESNFSYENGNHVSKAGSITFIPSNMPYTQSVVLDSEIIVLHFTTKCSLTKALCVDNTISSHNRVEITELFSQMLSCYNSKSLRDSAKMYSAFYSLLAVLQDLGGDKQQNRCIAQEADEILRANISNESFSIADVTATLTVSESYLRKAFIQRYGISPRKRLVSLRIKNACEMLSSGFYSVSEVASYCGFSSPSYFSRVFRHEMGKSPSEFLSPSLF